MTVDERTIEGLERAREEMGQLESSNDLMKDITKAFNKALRVCKIIDVSIDEIRQDAVRNYVLYFRGIMGKDDRKMVVEHMAQALDMRPEHFELVGFYC